jgi:transcriptional regulator with XRE-family HTH domain
MTPLRHFGADLRRLRQDTGLSLGEMADRSGLTLVSVSDLERGREKDITTVSLYLGALCLDTADKLALETAAKDAWRGAKERTVDDAEDGIRDAMSSLCSVCKSHPCPGCTGRVLDENMRLRARIKALEGALEDAIGAIEHAAHPVASQWLPSLKKKLER